MKKPHIAIEIPDYFPKEFDDLILSDIKHEKLDLNFQRNEPQMYAALEWVIPGLIATYILKPYFESFLKEAGKDHYQILKKTIGVLLSKAKRMNVKKVAASQSSEKIDNSDSQSRAISIFLETKDGYLIKLLYDNNLALGVWQEATNQIFDLIELHYENSEGDPISQYLKQLSGKKIGKEIYAFIDPKTNEWTLIHNLGQYMRNKRNEN